MGNRSNEPTRQAGRLRMIPTWPERFVKTGGCLILTGATALSCGETESGSSGSGGGGGSVESFDALLRELAASTCRGDCDDTNTTHFQVRYGAECLEIYTLVYEALGASIERSLDAGTVRYDAEAAQRCVDLLRNNACDEVDLTCEGVLVGQLAVGESCTNSTECAGNAYCSDDLACPGTCAATLGVGEACQGADFDECGDGFFCSAEGVCTAEKADGEPCDYSEECASYYCDYTEEGSRCVEIPPDYVKDVGELCDFDEECKPDLHCPQGTCTAAGEIGEPCPCVLEAYCSQASGDSGGVCVARIPLGAACETSEQCATGICDGGVCEKHSGLGGPCVTDERCFGVCDGGACAPYPACLE